MRSSKIVKYLLFFFIAITIAYLLATIVNNRITILKNKILFPIYFEYINAVEEALQSEETIEDGLATIHNQIQNHHNVFVINRQTSEVVYNANYTNTYFNVEQFIANNSNLLNNLSIFITTIYESRNIKYQTFLKKTKINNNEYIIIFIRNINEVVKGQKRYKTYSFMTFFFLLLTLLFLIDTKTSIKNLKSLFLKQIEKEKYFFQSLVKNNPQSLMVIIDTTFRIQDASEAFESLSLYSKNSLINMQIDEIVPNFDQLVSSFYENKNMDVEVELISKNNKTNIIAITLVPYFNIDGKIEKYLIIFNDLTEMKNKTEQLAKELNTTRTFSKISQLITNAEDHQLIVKAIIEESKKLVDYDFGTLFLVNNDELTAYYSSDPKIIENNKDFKLKIGQGLTGLVAKTQKGMIINNASESPIPSKVPNTDDADECLVSVPLISKTKLVGVVTFTRLGRKAFVNNDLKMLELITAHAASVLDSSLLINQLALSESKYITLINQSALAIVIFREMTITFCNKRFTEILELELENIINTDITSLIFSKDKATFASHLTSFLLDSHVDDFNITLINHQNKKVIMNFNLSNITWENTNSIMITAQDITEKVELDKQLLQTQKLESVGVLATGIAHDFKNILAGISGAADMILLREKKDSAIHNFAQIIKTSADRGTQLSQRLLGYSRKGDSELQIFNVNDVLNEIIEIVSYTFEKNIEISKNLSNDVLLFEGDSIKIQQCILNLCVNARDAMPKGGVLNIISEVKKVNELDGNIWNDLKFNLYIMVTVSDTGAGMSQELISQIFDPFFTTKEKGKGTGLGLSTTKRIIDEYNGKINVFSEINKGTNFKILLPMANDNIRLNSTDNDRNKPNKLVKQQVIEPLHILVVDDEELVLEVAKELLQELGNTVYTALSGFDALNIIKDTDNIKLALIDRMMPKMDGVELFYEIKKLDPSIKVVIASGFKNEEETIILLEDGLSDYITKPYSLDELNRIISEVSD
ncbi:MAG: response regulator [Candidatus Cloacimonadales bacterium]|nr:response regulator [Candidatus Cloacimonadota bacterium]